MADLASEILSQFTELLKSAKPSAAERQLLRDCATDAADVQIRALSGALTAAKAKAEMKQIDAQVRTIASIAGGRASALFWRAVTLAVGVVTKAVLPV